MDADLDFTLRKPPPSLADFVESFWCLRNQSASDKPIIVLPNGRIDLTLSISDNEPFHIVRSGLETKPQDAVLKGNAIMFAISFRLLTTEYIFHQAISNLVDYAEYLPPGFWGFSEADLQSFDAFCDNASVKIQSLITATIDPRKQKLFELIYSFNGEMPVKELSAKSFWSSRQINRYFTNQFGLSLKAYCSILRFRASFKHIKEGKLFPQQNFNDQSHFIREVKKLSGVSPKELQRNQNDRFIQFSALDPE